MAPDRRHLSTWPGSLGHDVVRACFALRSTGAAGGLPSYQAVSNSADVPHSIFKSRVMVPCSPVATRRPEPARPQPQRAQREGGPRRGQPGAARRDLRRRCLPARGLRLPHDTTLRPDRSGNVTAQHRTATSSTTREAYRRQGLALAGDPRPSAMRSGSCWPAGGARRVASTTI
jgi:hypothetical protein